MTKREIANLIESHVDYIFAAVQHKERIATGDVDPENEMRLTDAIDALADAMIRVLDEQKQHNKGDD